MHRNAFTVWLRCDTAEKLLAIGFVCLLTGLVWVGSSSTFHQLYYVLFALPALFLALRQPLSLGPLFATHTFQIFLSFAGFMLLTTIWSDTETGFFSLFKRPLYIALLFVGTFYLVDKYRTGFEQLLKLCIYFYAMAAVVLIIDHLGQPEGTRLTGYGALHNPLLTAHVFGMYAAMSLALLIDRSERLSVAVAMLCIFSIVLLMTGSRTPIVGLFAAACWLLALKGDRRTLIAVSIIAAALALGVVIKPEIILARGFSYRPEIWQQALMQIAERPILGHGFDNAARFYIAERDTAFHDPHNFLLGVWHAGGLVGLTLWLTLMAFALHGGWKLRHDWLALAASTALVFGLGSSLTEGDSFLSRPKEHWFLIWIPMSVLISLMAAQIKVQRRSSIKDA